MPSIPIHPKPQNESTTAPSADVPGILHTPSGLAILEIQGDINTSEGSGGDAPQSVGKLVFPGYDASKGPDDTSWHDRVYLYVGKHQRLTGQVKKLLKPIAVLRRRASVNGADGGDELEVAEIVRYKLLFAHRPEPVGAAPAEVV